MKKTAFFWACLVIFAASPPAYSAQEDEGETPTQAANPVMIEAGHTHEWLSNNYGEWIETRLGARQQRPNGVAVYGLARATERYGLADQEMTLGFGIPLGDRDDAVAEASASSSHKVLPMWTGMFEYDHRFDGQWSANVGLRRTEYDAARLTMGFVALEKYVGNWYARLAWQPANVEGLGSANSGIFNLRYYYGDRDYAGAGYAAGREIEGAGPVGTIFSDVEDASLSGRHQFFRTWSIEWNVGTHRQGAFYQRRWAGLGLGFEF